MMRKYSFLAAFAALVMSTIGALAQAGSIVVAACPSAVQIYSAGQTNRVPAIDVYGNLCGGTTVTGTTSNASSAVATGAGNVPTVSYNYGYNGATWDQLQVDASKNLKVLSQGASSNAASGVATGGANIPSIAYNYGFNGTTWDQFQVDASKNLKTVLSSQYPAGAVALTGNSTGSTGAVVGTLTAAVTSTTAYICGFNVSTNGGVASIGPITVAGLVGSSMVFQLFSTATGANLTQQFTPCVPASAVNTNITITTTADATASAVDVNSWGYRQ